mmetsp:Transcript_5376/g.10957  ORF Transcript_5376/g.10957 Transcript_5376/m.10957 type:complete len:292 (+) Transcript_5376:409-1284(+)
MEDGRSPCGAGQVGLLVPGAPHDGRRPQHALRGLPDAGVQGRRRPPHQDPAPGALAPAVGAEAADAPAGRRKAEELLRVLRSRLLPARGGRALGGQARRRAQHQLSPGPAHAVPPVQPPARVLPLPRRVDVHGDGRKEAARLLRERHTAGCTHGDSEALWRGDPQRRAAEGRGQAPGVQDHADDGLATEAQRAGHVQLHVQQHPVRELPAADRHRRHGRARPTHGRGVRRPEVQGLHDRPDRLHQFCQGRRASQHAAQGGLGDVQQAHAAGHHCAIHDSPGDLPQGGRGRS